MSATAPATNACLEWALAYHRLGWSVIPVHTAQRRGALMFCSCGQADCASPGKHPALRWTQFQRERATETQIRSWWEGAFRGYGVGLVTGAVSGLFVVDVDSGPGKLGAETIHDLQMEHDDLPDTVTAKTGGGGRHLVYQQPAGVKTKTGKNVLGPGVDVRGDGGFVVAAPSLHASGTYYLWDEERHPMSMAPAEAPEWLLGLARDGGGTNPAAAPTGAHLSVDGYVVDERESYMVRVIWACAGAITKRLERIPTADEVFAEAWPTYERKAKARGESLEADGRGQTLMRQRIAYHLGRAVRGESPLLAKALESVVADAIMRGAQQLGYDPETGEILDGAERFRLTRWRDIKPQIDTSDFVQGLLSEGAMSIVYGASNVGKSHWVLNLAVHVASGTTWRDRRVERGGVVYVAAEGGPGLRNRVQAYKDFTGISDIPLGIVQSTVNILDPVADIEDFCATIMLAGEQLGEKVKLVIIDTLSRAMAGGNENASEDMGAFVMNADKIREATGCHLLFVHHSGKDAAKGARGHSLLRAATDTEIEITHEAPAFPIVAQAVKQREMECTGTFAFRLRTVTIGHNRYGEPVRSCVIDQDMGWLPKPTKVKAKP